jgi:hypothetical protein
MHANGEAERKSRIGRLKVVTGGFMEGANRLYIGCCFELAGQFENHGIASNVHVVQVDSALSKWREPVREVASDTGQEKPEIVEISRKDRETQRARTPDQRQQTSE